MLKRHGNKAIVAHTITPKMPVCICVVCKGFNDEEILAKILLAHPLIHFGPVLVSISQSFAARVAYIIFTWRD